MSTICFHSRIESVTSEGETSKCRLLDHANQVYLLKILDLFSNGYQFQFIFVLVAVVSLVFCSNCYANRKYREREKKIAAHYGNRLPINCSVLLLFNLFFLTISRFFLLQCYIEPIQAKHHLCKWTLHRLFYLFRPLNKWVNGRHSANREKQSNQQNNNNNPAKTPEITIYNQIAFFYCGRPIKNQPSHSIYRSNSKLPFFSIGNKHGANL